MFNRKAVIELKEKPEMDLEEFEMELIDGGLEELRIEDDGSLTLFADYTEFGNMTKKLEEMGIEYEKASLQRIPTTPIEITDDQMEELSILLDKLEDDEDVQNIYTNLA